MNVRQTNLGLQTTAIILVTGAGLSIAAAFLVPLQIARETSALQKPSIAGNHVRTLPAVDSFTPLFMRSLQAPAGAAVSLAAAQVDASAAEPTVPISQLVLVGTVGNSIALIKGPDGSIAMIEPGDDVEGSAVLAVRPSQVDLRVNGKLTTLQMVPAPDDSRILQTK